MEEIDKLYDAILKLSKRISELDQRNIEIESILSSMTPSQQKEDAYILDQENTIVDSYNISGYKNVSLPNGGVIKLKSKSFCANGRHVIENLEKMIFCAKCNAIICREHYLELDGEPACVSCLKNELNGVDDLSLYILSAISDDFPLWRLRRLLNVDIKEFKTALKNLLELKYIKQNLIFSYEITLYGRRVLNLAENLYDFPCTKTAQNS